RDRELPSFGQETLIDAQSKGPLTEARYRDAKARCAKWSEELVAVLETNRLDAIVAPTTGPAHALALIVGGRGGQLDLRGGGGIANPHPAVRAGLRFAHRPVVHRAGLG